MSIIDSLVKFYAENPDQLTVQFVLFLLLLLIYRGYTKSVEKSLNAKDKEIERLAEDNRKYREIYLLNIKKMDISDYNDISAVEIDDKEKGK